MARAMETMTGGSAMEPWPVPQGLPCDAAGGYAPAIALLMTSEAK